MPEFSDIAPSDNESIFSKDNPNGLPNRLPDKLWERVAAVPQDLLDMTEGELEIRLYAQDRGKRGFPLILENRLRLAFWAEYSNACASGEKMRVVSLCRGICDHHQFYAVFRDPLKCAWIVCRPAEYIQTLEEGLYSGHKRLREFLAFPVCKKDGTPDYKAALTQLKIVEMLEARLHGGVPQKVDARVLNVNLPSGLSSKSYTSRVGYQQAHGQLAASNANSPIDAKVTMEEIDKELRYLEERASQAKNILVELPPGLQTIDVESEGDES